MKNLKRTMTGLLLALALLLVPYSTVTAQAATRIRGIDVSRWQGKINWSSVKKSGVKFVMIGMGRYRNGKGLQDPTFKYNIRNASKQGIKVGVYLYSEATSAAGARREARYVLKQIDGYKISYPVAFDMEASVHLNMTRTQRTNIALAFMEEIEKAGYYPMIYASENWFTQRMDMSRLKNYDKWVARWSGSVKIAHKIWQYSSTGRIKGIPAAVDLNVSYVDYSKIITPRRHAIRNTAAAAALKNRK